MVRQLVGERHQLFSWCAAGSSGAQGCKTPERAPRPGPAASAHQARAGRWTAAGHHAPIIKRAVADQQHAHHRHQADPSLPPRSTPARAELPSCRPWRLRSRPRGRRAGALVDDASGDNLQRGEQRGRAVSHVVMGAPLGSVGRGLTGMGLSEVPALAWRSATAQTCLVPGPKLLLGALMSDHGVQPPDLLPMLSRQAPQPPHRCLLHGTRLTAGRRALERPPACTHPLLAAVARQVNDHTSDAGRQRLADLGTYYGPYWP